MIDGRNVWRADLEALLDRLEPVAAGRDLVLAPSCSLLHVPVDLALEPRLDDELKQWLAFAAQKIEELNLLKQALNEGARTSPDTRSPPPRGGQSRGPRRAFTTARCAARIAAATPPAMRERKADHPPSACEPRRERPGPAGIPDHHIGSFPQTAEVRHARARA